MSMGHFDHEEYERRERRLAALDADSDDPQPRFEGQVTYSEESVEDLLALFETSKANRER